MLIARFTYEGALQMTGELRYQMATISSLLHRCADAHVPLTWKALGACVYSVYVSLNTAITFYVNVNYFLP